MKNYFTFTSKDNKYIFDNSTGYIYPFSKQIEKNLDNNNINENKSIFETSDISPVYQDIIQYISNLVHPNNNLIPNKERYLDMLYHSPSSQLILIITNQCNMRCKYCIYSEQYPNTISYQNTSMHMDVAKKAIQDYMGIFQEKKLRGYIKNPVINFYGGEPLLNFKLITNVINFIRDNYKINVDYYITTNGTLLTDDIIDFLLDNNFRVTISLDGNKSNHDRNRVFANNLPTHELIIKNILSFSKRRQMHGNSKSLLTFNACIDEYTSIKQMINFFNNELTIDELGYVFFSQINPFDTNYYKFCDNEYQAGRPTSNSKVYKKEYQELESKFLQSNIKNTPIPTILRSFFTNYYYYRNRIIKSEGYFHNSCIPGSKIAINSEGNYFLCERVCERFIIGNIKHGINWKRIKLLLHKYNKVNRKYPFKIIFSPRKK